MFVAIAVTLAGLIWFAFTQRRKSAPKPADVASPDHGRVNEAGPDSPPAAQYS
jgi:hypothetical protein